MLSLIFQDLSNLAQESRRQSEGSERKSSSRSENSQIYSSNVQFEAQERTMRTASPTQNVELNIINTSQINSGIKID